MIILSTSTTAQSLSVIPRSYASIFSVVVRDDSTNIPITYNIYDGVTSGNYLNFNNAFSLVEGHFYDIELYYGDYERRVEEDGGTLESVQCNTLFNDSTSIYKDRIFCTDQDIDQTTNNHYELNEGQYTTYNGSNNDYIVI
jgi:hypothetical protein